MAPLYWLGEEGFFGKNLSLHLKLTGSSYPWCPDSVDLICSSVAVQGKIEYVLYYYFCIPFFYSFLALGFFEQNCDVLIKSSGDKINR